MAKVNGGNGDVFICYKDEKPTFNIVTNGDEAANGGVDDGIFEYRPLTYQDMMNGDILDQMAQKNTLSNWQRYVSTTPSNSNNTPPEPSKTPTPEPSKTPTPEPSKTPTPEPSKTPTPEPSKTPTPEPSKTPTPEPSK
ncbi:hypothetical protein RY831_22475, partial [Noviherbaspirillum sp. CPCC 100848]